MGRVDTTLAAFHSSRATPRDGRSSATTIFAGQTHCLYSTWCLIRVSSFFDCVLTFFFCGIKSFVGFGKSLESQKKRVINAIERPLKRRVLTGDSELSFSMRLSTIICGRLESRDYWERSQKGDGICKMKYEKDTIARTNRQQRCSSALERTLLIRYH